MSAKRKVKVNKGTRKRRKARPKEKEVAVGYHSNWEYKLHMGLLSSWEHHPQEENIINYVINHKYHPDFIAEIDGKTILLESKGRFWDYHEYNKYPWIKKALPDHMELVFLFAEPNAPMPQAKRRKDGTKRSHAEWAWSHSFRWFSEESLPDSWADAEFRKQLKETNEEDIVYGKKK